MTELHQRAGATLIGTAAHIVKHQAAFHQMACGQLLLDAFLPFQQPVHGGVKVIFAGLLHSQLFRQGGSAPLTRGRQFGGGRDQPLDDHGHDQVSFAATLGGDQGVEVEPADHRQDRLHVAVGRGMSSVQQILGGDQGLAAQHAAQGIDLGLRPSGEENGGRGVAVGNGFDVHGSYYSHIMAIVKHNICTYMGT